MAEPLLTATRSPGAVLDDRSERAAERAYAVVRGEILTGVHQPGETLLETAVSTALAVSRTPVREALVRLAQDGLLVRAPRGFVVRRRTVEEILDIYDTRIVVEGHGAAIGALRRTTVDLAQLRAIQQANEETADLEEMDRLNLEFHTAMKRSWHSEALVEEAERLQAQVAVYSYRTKGSREVSQQNLEEHRRILAAIEAADPAAAQEAVVDHLTRIRDQRIARMLGGQTPAGRI